MRQQRRAIETLRFMGDRDVLAIADVSEDLLRATRALPAVPDAAPCTDT